MPASGAKSRALLLRAVAAFAVAASLLDRAAADDGNAGPAHALTDSLPPGCKDAVCRSAPSKVMVSMCVFGRLGPGAPAFALPLNPKSGSSTVRNAFKGGAYAGLVFEAACNLHARLGARPAERLNVTGWGEVALAVVVRDPMDRFVSAWNEITLRASMNLPAMDGLDRSGLRVNGFMWMRQELKDLMDRQRQDRMTLMQAVRVLRTPEYFRRFQEAYLERAEELDDPLSWDYDTHLAPQVLRMGLCSEHPPQARVVIRLERLAQDMPRFLARYAGATEARDGALLRYFRSPPRHRRAASPELLAVADLVRRSPEHRRLWQRIRDGVNMWADYTCTGYKAEQEHRAALPPAEDEAEAEAEGSGADVDGDGEGDDGDPEAAGVQHPAALAEALPTGCEEAACPGPFEVGLVSMCIFGRLSPERPAFVVHLNPKSGSTTVRLTFRHHEASHLTFEAPCDVRQEMPPPLQARLNVTGWGDVALAVVVREPMQRFVSSWHEVTSRLAMHVPRELPAAIKGFMWMRQELVDAMERNGTHRISTTSAAEALRTPEYFRRFSEKYLELAAARGAPLSWDYDTHLAPQALRMGVCSQQPLRARVVIQLERLAQDMPEFLARYAGAAEARDGALLTAFRGSPRHRRAALGGSTLAAWPGSTELWRRVRDSANVWADYMCTGYPVPEWPLNKPETE